MRRFWESDVPAAIGPLTISPEVAVEMLGSNTANRRRKDIKIDRYARDMMNGSWRLTG